MTLSSVRTIAVATTLLALSFAPGHTQSLHLEPAMVAKLAELPLERGPSVDPHALQTQPAVVAFFASWCVPCRAGFVEFRKLIERTGPENLSVVAINWLEDAGHYPGESFRLQRMLDRVAPHITVVTGDATTSEMFGEVTSLPTLFVFDDAGNETFRFEYDGVSPPSHPTEAELFQALTARR